MKRLLFILLTMPVLASAQNFEFGVNGGLAIHSIPMGNRYTSQDKAQLSYYAAAKADLKTPGFRIGVGVEMVNLQEHNTLLYNYTYNVDNNLAKPLIAPHLFANKTFDIPKGYAYVGIMAGPVLAKMGINTLEYTPAGTVSGYTTEYFSETGYVAGAQTGLVFDVSKHLGINIEGALRFTSFKHDAPNEENTYHVFYFPLSVGLRYGI